MTKEHRVGKKDGKFTGNKAEDTARVATMDVYFNEAGENRYVPRVALDVVKETPVAAICKPDNYVHGANCAGNNWAKGHYAEGAEIIDGGIDVTRRETEACDYPQGYQISLGMGTLLLMKIRDDYPHCITCTFSVYPSPKVSDVIVKPHNATLSIHKLLENSDEPFVVDNETLCNVLHNILKQKQPKYTDLNWVLSLVISGIAASLRFSVKLNGHFRKINLNLTFPRLHFLQWQKQHYLHQ